MALTEGQQRCVNTLDRPLVVAAGAGSGKTFTLTKRIVGALQSGFLADIDEVCAITFTKKAAAELKSRLKGELRACNLIAQALKVDEAWVSTIHGMCARILRAHAVELGIDPAFTVAEGAQLQRYIDRAVDAVLIEAQASDSSARLDALFAEYPARSFGGFGVSVESMLIDLVGIASSQANGVEAFVLPGLTMKPHQAVEVAVELMEDVLALAESEKESAKRDEWMAQAGQWIQEARAALEGELNDPAEALDLIMPFRLAKTFGSKGFKARVDEARCELGAYQMEVRLGAARAHLETLVELARRALDVFTELKHASGMLDNNDLLVLAARALEEHPSIAARYANKFKLVMVDEFQDTDQMQVDMIKRLSGEGACRLCTVGDAQQSIYRFRGADVSVYRRHLSSVRDQWDDAIIELSQNFRSHADVLSFVDRVFEQPSMFGGEFMSLSPGRDDSRVKAPFDSAKSRIVVQHTTRPWRGVSAGEACLVAARRIASSFAELARAGHSPNEMVVLLGRMSNAGVYAQAMRDAGLACVISGGSVFANTPEAGLVRELVRVIADPNETQSLFNVLTSPLFSLSAGDLLKAGCFKGFWKAAGALAGLNGDGAMGEKVGDCPSDYSPQLVCALRVMGEARKASSGESVSRIVERIAVESGWLTRLERGGTEGLASAGNLYKAIRMIRSVEQAGACGPVSVMREFEDLLENSKEAPGALSVTGGNSVRIMTIHASKGLEFPIVAIAEVKENSAPTSRLLAASVSGNVYLSLDLSRTVEGKSSTVSLDDVSAYVLGERAGEDELALAVTEDAGALHRRLALRSYIATGDEEEAKRLLYVAITRAKEAVIVASLGKCTKGNPLGVPKSAVAGVFSALDPVGDAIGEGTTCIEFGGSRPAVVEHVNLESDELSSDISQETVQQLSQGFHGNAREDELERTSGDVSDGLDEAIGGEAQDELFFVPAFEESPAVSRETFKTLGEGAFSYSSIADASHEGDLLKRLAAAYAVAVDEGSGAEEGSASGCGGDLDEEAEPVRGNLFDDDSADLAASRSFDEDRATDLGTAFHRLAQYAVTTKADEGGLVPPPRERVEALSRSCSLREAQRARLAKALDRWFGCDLAHEVGGLARLSAEVPFFITVTDEEGEGAAPVFLEGEIDLLGFDEAGTYAHVVDYKTGGRSDEGLNDLREKHVLQATCYAYAVLLQGADRVVADFVRVERGRADDPTQPQCVRYQFSQGDLARLERAISEAYSLAKR